MLNDTNDIISINDRPIENSEPKICYGGSFIINTFIFKNEEVQEDDESEIVKQTHTHRAMANCEKFNEERFMFRQETLSFKSIGVAMH